MVPDQGTRSKHYWRLIKDFFDEHYQCTKYAGETSTVAEVKSSVIKGFGLGSVSFLVTASNLHPLRTGNYIFKYADDTYLVMQKTRIMGLSGSEDSLTTGWAVSTQYQHVTDRQTDRRPAYINNVRSNADAR